MTPYKRTTRTPAGLACKQRCTTCSLRHPCGRRVDAAPSFPPGWTALDERAFQELCDEVDFEDQFGTKEYR